MTKKVKDIVVTLLILVALGISLAFMIIPDKIEYQHSLKYLKDKEYELDSLASNITQNKTMIKEEIMDFKSLEKEVEDARVLRELIMKDKYFIDLDIPSLLIFLEQEAIASDVELSIDFGKIINHEKPEEHFDMDYEDMDYEDEIYDLETNEIIDGEVEEIEEIEKKEEKVENKEDIETADKSKELIDTIKRNEKEVSRVLDGEISFIDDVILEEIPNIKGLDVTTVPIKVKGNYKNIENFMRRLDVVDYLEPGYMGAYSSGENVTSVITLFVFHKEGGDI